jgi:hypothetical protein
VLELVSHLNSVILRRQLCIALPTASTLVPTISMIRRKDSMAAVIAGNHDAFQYCV